MTRKPRTHEPKYEIEVEYRPDREAELRALMLALGMTEAEIADVVNLRREHQLKERTPMRKGNGEQIGSEAKGTPVAPDVAEVDDVPRGG